MLKKRIQMLLFGGMILAFVGCGKTTTKDRLLLDKKEYGTVYFVRGTVDTPIPLSCNNYLNNLDFLISYFKIEDKEFINSLLMDWQTGDIVKSNSDLDVRYRIEFEDTVICIDDFGNYAVDNVFVGKLSNFQLLLDYIETHRESSIKMKEDFPFVDDK
ncbi:hypothetical protein [Myroides sp. DW712]|uniref:hypothetical protein n=1 Tax=Myroides sp. DW712 TaxID=3389800 RepID=UPI003979ACDC